MRTTTSFFRQHLTLTQKKRNMDFVLFFSCFSLAFGILFILFGSEKTQLTKGIEVSTAVQIAALIVGCILIFAGLFGFYNGMRNVYIRHEKHLKKQHEFEQKRRQTTMRV